MDILTELETLAAAWEKEGRGYMKLAGIMRGSLPEVSTPQQAACSYSAGTYRTCAHEVRLLLKKAKQERKPNHDN